MAAVATDCASWQLDDKEAAALASPACAALNETVTVAPKWVAISMFAFSLAGVLADKWARYEVFKRVVAREGVEPQPHERAAQAAEQTVGPGPSQPAAAGAAGLIARPADPGAAR